MKTEKVKRQGGEIRNWRIVDGQVTGDLFFDPEMQRKFKLKEGDMIRTSLIESITLETRNTTYKLDPDSAK